MNKVWLKRALACTAAAALVLGIAPSANASGAHTASVTCDGPTGPVGGTVTFSSGGSTARTSISMRTCTNRISVRADYKRGQQPGYNTGYYHSTGSTVAISPGQVMFGKHLFRLKSGQEFYATT